VRLPAGAPAPDPHPLSTQKLSLDALLPGETQKLPRAALDEVQGRARKLVLPTPEDQPLRTQKLSLPAEAAGQTEPPPEGEAPAKGGGWKAPLGLAALALLGLVAYLLFSRGAGAPPSAPVAPESVPPDAQAYFEQAKAGDAHAMRMLGVMYYYGLNVPQDREKGLYWYRRAAERGSDAARAELDKLGIAPK
jgi:TPR repeat protein